MNWLAPCASVIYLCSDICSRAFKLTTVSYLVLCNPNDAINKRRKPDVHNPDFRNKLKNCVINVSSHTALLFHHHNAFLIYASFGPFQVLVAMIWSHVQRCRNFKWLHVATWCAIKSLISSYQELCKTQMFGKPRNFCLFACFTQKTGEWDGNFF